MNANKVCTAKYRTKSFEFICLRHDNLKIFSFINVICINLASSKLKYVLIYLCCMILILTYFAVSQKFLHNSARLASKISILITLVNLQYSNTSI